MTQPTVTRRLLTSIRVGAALNAIVVSVIVWLAWPAVMAEPDPQYLEDIAAEMTALMAEGQEGLENAAPIYEEAIAELERLEAKWNASSDRWWSGHMYDLSKEPWDPVELETALAAFREGNELFALLDRAAELDGLALHLQPDVLGFVSSPILDNSIAMSFAHQTRLRVACMNADWAIALQTIQSGLGSARLFAWASSPIGLFYSRAMERVLVPIIHLSHELVLPTEFCEDAIAVIEEDLQRSLDVERFIRGMELELRSSTSRGYDRRGRLLKWWISKEEGGWFDDWFGSYDEAPNLAERLWNVMSIFGTPEHEAFLKKLDEIIPKIQQWVQLPNAERPSYEELDWNDALGEFGGPTGIEFRATKYDEVHYHHAAVITLLRLEIYFNEHGVWPESLNELPGGVPIEPLYGEPFQYERVEDDEHGRPYLLYWSVPTGPDLVEINTPR